jgi:GTP:adenosylcobinamide-phosphate guanylyltransferase
MGIPAVVTAGDQKAAKAIYGESKPYLELGGRPLVAHVVAVLQQVPEVDAVWVVGNAQRLEAALAGLRDELRKPLHVLPQFRNLYENGWEAYRRLLPGAPAEGRDPRPEEQGTPVLYLSADVPFATPQEISGFIQRALAAGCDYGLGLCTEESMRAFYPKEAGEPGIRMAYFNLQEGRFRQSNLHLIRPARIGNRPYVEEMYEHRYQKQIGQIIALAWRLLRIREGGLRVIYYFLLLQLASIADRRGWDRLAARLRARIPMARIEAGAGELLRTDFRFVVTEVGGCAVDIDNEPDFDAARARFEEWHAAQRARAQWLHGALPAPGRTADGSAGSRR